MAIARTSVISLITLFSIALCAAGEDVSPKTTARGQLTGIYSLLTGAAESAVSPQDPAPRTQSQEQNCKVCPADANLQAGEMYESCCLAKASSISLQVQPSEHFLLFHTGQTVWARRMTGLLERAHGDFRGWMKKTGFTAAPIKGRLIWVCFRRPDDFDRYSLESDQVDMSWTDGYYSAKTNRVALVLPPRTQQKHSDDAVEMAANNDDVTPFGPLPDTSNNVDARWITHELAHQLSFNCGVQKRGVMYPLWLSEGLATNFEADNSGRFGFGRDNQPRRQTLLEARAQGRLTKLFWFVSMDHLEPNGEEQARIDYAQCWGLFAFLSREHPDQLRQYLETVHALDVGSRDATTMRNEFVAAFGPIKPVEREWLDWVDGLAGAAG